MGGDLMLLSLQVVSDHVVILRISLGLYLRISLRFHSVLRTTGWGLCFRNSFSYGGTKHRSVAKEGTNKEASGSS